MSKNCLERKFPDKPIVTTGATLELGNPNDTRFCLWLQRGISSFSAHRQFPHSISGTIRTVPQIGSTILNCCNSINQIALAWPPTDENIASSVCNAVLCNLLRIS